MSNRKWPPQIKYIIGNEGCERYSFYGMRAILTVFMTQYLMMKADVSTEVMHAFIGASYFLPLLGAYVADRFLGRYHTILYFSLFYCAGHGTLALFENQTGLFIGLGLIALGAGSIKPCVSSFVGDQFVKGQEDMVTKVYNLFYFIINFGSTFSSILTPITLAYFGPSIAFGIPGILMAIATVIFWMGRKHYTRIPPSGADKDSFWATLRTGIRGKIPAPVRWLLFILVAVAMKYIYLPADFAEATVATQAMEGFGFFAYTLIVWSAILIVFNAATGHFMSEINKHHPKARVEEFTAVVSIMKVFAAVSVFWALFDQSASTWVLQGLKMKQEVDVFGLFSFPLLASQMQAANPILVMLFIPTFVLFIYPAINSFFPLTPLRKMTIGMGLASFGFGAVAVIQYTMEAGTQLGILWQLIPYILMTGAEVMVSITGLEFAYTQAPKTVKSTVMSFWLLTVAIGSFITVLIVKYVTLEVASANYFLLFTVLMAVTAAIFGFIARFYKLRSYLN